MAPRLFADITYKNSMVYDRREILQHAMKNAESKLGVREDCLNYEN